MLWLIRKGKGDNRLFHGGPRCSLSTVTGLIERQKVPDAHDTEHAERLEASANEY